MMNIKIRIADTADVTLLTKLSSTTFFETFATQNDAANMTSYMAENFTEVKLFGELTDKKSIFLIVTADDEIAGYAKLRESANPEMLQQFNCLEIERIYALKKFIGQGIGKSLLERCIDIAKNMQKEIIWLGVWERNMHAIEFYKKFGFEIFGSHIFQLGNDEQTDYLMKLNLS